MVDASGVKGVSETMLLPLMGRAMETKKSDGILNDVKSLDIYNELDYDFNRFDGSDVESSMTRTVIRTCIIDKIVGQYIKEHPSMTVVEIGCGLNTRFDRLDNGSLRWFDLDVQEVHRVWREFFVEDERHTFLPCSAFEERWMEEVRREGSEPYFFISEASVIYFPEQKVRELFVGLNEYFSGGYYLFDSATPDFLEKINDGDDPLKYCDAHMSWGLEDVDILSDWVDGIEVIERVDIEDRDNRYSHLYPDDFDGYKEGYYLNLVSI